MDRRKFFSFLAATPVGVVAAGTQAKASLAETTDVTVKVTPGEKCIHCGSPQHHMVTDLVAVQVPTGNPYVTTSGLTHQAKKVCSWCSLPWVGKPYQA